jgi:hypothetical protein
LQCGLPIPFIFCDRACLETELNTCFSSHRYSLREIALFLLSYRFINETTECCGNDNGVKLSHAAGSVRGKRGILQTQAFPPYYAREALENKFPLQPRPCFLPYVIQNFALVLFSTRTSQDSPSPCCLYMQLRSALGQPSASTSIEGKEFSRWRWLSLGRLPILLREKGRVFVSSSSAKSSI